MTAAPALLHGLLRPAALIGLDPAPGLCLDFTRVPPGASRSGPRRRDVMGWPTSRGMSRQFRFQINPLPPSATPRRHFPEPSCVCLHACACACVSGCIFTSRRRAYPLSLPKTLKEIDKKGAKPATKPATKPRRSSPGTSRIWQALGMVRENPEKGGFAHA